MMSMQVITAIANYDMEAKVAMLLVDKLPKLVEQS
jgi:hypothetical protein